MRNTLLALLALLAAAPGAAQLPRPEQTIGPASKITCDNSTMSLSGSPDTVQECLEALDTQLPSALAANGANCSAGSYPLGVDASGAVESCTAASQGTSVFHGLILEPAPVSFGAPCPGGNQPCGYFNFVEQFFSATALTDLWTQTNVTDGLAQVGTVDYHHVLTISHGTANQGPSVRLSSANFRGNAINTVGAETVFAFESRVRFQTNANSSDLFVGYMSDVAQHPLLSTGALNLAAIPDGVGFHFLDAANGAPVLVAWRNGVQETLTSPPTLTAWGNSTGNWHRVGIRVETPAAPSLSVIEWYLDDELIHTHTLSAVFTDAMTFGIGLIANASNATVWVDTVIVAGVELP